MSIKLSNVLGVPFRPFVRDQLKARVKRGITGGRVLSNTDVLRSADDVAYLGNQLAWVKLASSVVVSTDYLKMLRDQFAQYGDNDAFLENEWTPTGLAKKWVLQAGTSKVKEDPLGSLQSGVDLRAGIGNDGAYGLGGFKTQGYRPMPGITSVQIKSAGRLGSLRYATIDFKVWNRNQLDIIDALYLRLGYTMLLEWGHIHYFETVDSETLRTDVSGVNEFFKEKITKEELQFAINQKVAESRGNYDAMLGVVCNFNCSFNQEGGWDCSVKLIGLGSIMESQKINLSYTMPPSIKKQWEWLKTQRTNQRIAELQEAADRRNQAALEDAENAYNDRMARYNRDNPIQDIATFAANKFGAGENDQLNGIFAAVRPLLDYSQENNIVEGSNNDLDNATAIRIAPPVASLSSVAADYYNSGVLYLAHLGEVGYVNPLTPNKSIIVISPSKLNEIGQKLATNRALKYQPEVIAEAGNAEGVIDNILTLGGLIPQVIEAAGRTFSDDLPLTRFTEQGQEFFTTLLGLELRRRSYFEIVKNNGVAIESFIGFSGFDSNGFSYKQNVLIYNTATNQLVPAQPVNQRLSVALAGVYDQNGSKLSNQYKFLSGVATSNFIASVLAAVSDYNTNYRMKVTDLEDGKYGEKYATTYIAKQEDLIKIQPAAGTTEFQFETPGGSILKYSELQIKLSIESSIPSLIEDIRNEDVTQREGPFEAPTPVDADTDQVLIDMENVSLGLGSALEAMLTIVKYDAIVEYASNPAERVQPKDITSITAKFLKDGTGSLSPMAPLFEGTNLNVLSTDPNAINKIDNYPFLKPIKESSDASLVLRDPTSLGVKGYCTALMQDYNQDPSPVSGSIKTPLSRWEEVPSVNFKKLFTSYLIPKYILNSALDAPKARNEYPVYISLGYLLFFINNQSLLYDTTKESPITVAGTNRISRPIFYIDYNPETNLCGTIPSQLSIDPDICMIPYSGGTSAYKKLFIFGIEPGEKLFTTGRDTDRVSAAIAGYKRAGNEYQAHTMDILLNIDYLLNLIKSTIDRDKHNNVYLQPFLEQILADVNRSIGDVNAFRVAYNDSANTVSINDDQRVPPLKEEQSIFEIGKQLTGNSKNLFELPVFENISLARNFTLQTDTSTRMSRAIAIGAQAANKGSSQSVDASSYHWLNNGFVDRLIEVKENVTTPIKKNNNDDANLILATKFNTHIKNIYSTGSNIYREGTDPARNFLIQSATKIKAEDTGSYASLTIPYNATVSLTGISGIMMGNAFLLPDKILPISIRGTEAQAKYGFYVMGLEHTLDSNMWVTDIKGQIVRILVDRTPSVALAASTDTQIQSPTSQAAGTAATNFVASNTGPAATAREAVVSYFGASITDTEWNELVALIYAEAGNTREQRAYIAAIILNRARQEGRTIADSIRVENAYQPVTGVADDRTPSQSFVDGPTPQRETDIYETLSTSLQNIPKGYNAFTALNPLAYKRRDGTLSESGLRYRQRLLDAKNEGNGAILYNNNNPSNPNGTIVAQL